VTDANVVLGYMPEQQRLGGDMMLDRGLATAAVKTVGDALGLTVQQAAEGIYNIVNENMTGALRLVSVEQGYDPREYALMAFGGAGPLHANALSKLLGSWPAIIPPGPGVLCALGDATTAIRDERSRTYVRKFSNTSADEIVQILEALADEASKAISSENVQAGEVRTNYEVDLRYHGQGLRLSVDVDIEVLKREGLSAIAARFDEEHKRLFTFALELEHELVTLRAAVRGKGTSVKRPPINEGSADPTEAVVGRQSVFMEGTAATALVYDRAKLKSGNKVPGPAIVMEMDSTTVILPRHYGAVDPFGNILIYPDGYDTKAARQRAKAQK
jgi:N-methylhydantoinase A